MSSSVVTSQHKTMSCSMNGFRLFALLACAPACVSSNPSFPEPDATTDVAPTLSTGSGAETRADDSGISTSGTLPGTESSSEECPPSSRQTCDLTPPSGWGPLVAAIETGTTCPAGQPPVLEVLASADGEPASCTCSCGSPEGIDCRAARLQYSEFSFCGGGNNPEIVLAADGTNCEATAATQSHIGLEVELIGGSDCYESESPCTSTPSCTPQLEMTVEPAEQETTGFCALESVACGDSLCVTNAFGPVCTYAFGDHDCPEAFPKRSVESTETVDTRSCTDCECGPATGIQCSAQVDWYHTEADCEDGEAPFATEQVLQGDEGCGTSDNPGVGAAVLSDVSVVQPGSCLALGGTPTGDVSFDTESVVTVCCTD